MARDQASAPQTPMLQQFFKAKEAYPDAILFFRMGDFFELFFDDAILASRLLEITLTSRGKTADGEPGPPMAGVPAHAAEGYVNKLVKLGYKVALCDQVEDPRTARGLVRREVVRVATPGTTSDPGALARESVFLMAMAEVRGVIGIGFVELSTGRLDVCEIESAAAGGRICDEMARYQPREVLLPAGTALADLLPPDHGAALTERAAELASPERAAERLRRHLKVTTLDGLGLAEAPAATAVAGLLLAYLEETQKASLAHVRTLELLRSADAVALDASTVRNLELVRSLHDPNSGATLLAVLDKTRTAMGGRMLRDRLLRPSRLLEVINRRLDAVTAFHADGPCRARLREGGLDRVHDLERLLARVTMGSANARDLLSLRESIRALPHVKSTLAPLTAPLLVELAGRIDEMRDLVALLDRAIADDAPTSLRDGGLIKRGYDPKLDELKGVATEGRSWIVAYEQKQRQATGIGSLKVRFNKVFGYSIEVTRSNLGAVPTSYERRQTLANAERYTTQELKEHEALVLEADERLLDLEYEMFIKVREQAAGEAERIAESARAVAEIDCLAALAEVAASNGWACPQLAESGPLVVTEGRHPVVEAGLKGERFVPNDLTLDGDEHQVLLVTGPNMGGKSTYLRQTALIAILAHAGSFVPAATARVPLLDRIFTRVGASDDLARGRSTFMVEMIETANILHNASGASLVILDEVGRGTSTFDGLSLAWAIVEHLHDHPRGRPLVLFATHYHELTDLADLLPRVSNVRVAVDSHRGKIVFLRKIEAGRSDRSYGIEVARLAGLPTGVVDRARHVLRELEAVELGLEERLRPAGTRHAAQMTLFVPASHPVLDELRRVDTDTLTPIEALGRLADLARRARDEL